MQKKSRPARVGLEIDGIVFEGLNECSQLKSTKGKLNGDYPGGGETFSNGQKKWEPITGAYLDRADTGINEFLYDWYSKDEYHDVTYIEFDGHGHEVGRWLIPDAENVNYEKEAWNASGPVTSRVKFELVFDTAIKQG